MSQQAAAPVPTDVGMSSMNAPNASVGVPIGASTAPGTPGAPSPVLASKGILGALSKMNNMANVFGKTPDERVANLKAYTDMVKDIGNTVSKLQESTLLQRMMEAKDSGPSFLSSGASPSGGLAAIPKTFDPTLASHIMSQMGYK